MLVACLRRKRKLSQGKIGSVELPVGNGLPLRRKGKYREIVSNRILSGQEWRVRYLARTCGLWLTDRTGSALQPDLRGEGGADASQIRVKGRGVLGGHLKKSMGVFGSTRGKRNEQGSVGITQKKITGTPRLTCRRRADARLINSIKHVEQS